MNFDFHYYAVKVLARAAGFDERPAEIIAYASQYTDDATLYEPVTLSNPGEAGALDERLRAWIERLAAHDGQFDVQPGRSLLTDDERFDPICTAHSDIESTLMKLAKSLQLAELAKKVEELLCTDTQRKVYIPFHFMPGDVWDGEDAPDYPFFVQRNGQLVNQLVDAIGAEYQQSGDDLTLVAMGCAVHSLADTYSHEGFSGRLDKHDNDIEELYISTDDFADDREVSILPELGHIEAKSFPDQSNIGIRFEFDHGILGRAQSVDRHNAEHFLEAARTIYERLQAACQTSAAVGWDQLETPLLSFLKSEGSTSKRKDALADELAGTFTPALEFRYDDDAWEDAVKDGDYRYDVSSLWFQFHIAAAAQRAIVIGATPRLEDARAP